MATPCVFWSPAWLCTSKNTMNATDWLHPQRAQNPNFSALYSRAFTSFGIEITSPTFTPSFLKRPAFASRTKREAAADE